MAADSPRNIFVSLSVLMIVSSLKIVKAHAQINGSAYIEYHPSMGLNLILSVPHGGEEQPDGIPNRDAGCFGRLEAGFGCKWEHNCGEKNFDKCRAIAEPDDNTIALVRKVRLMLCSIFRGNCPAVIINHMHRKKLDANRPQGEATFMHKISLEAYESFHQFIERELLRLGRDNRGLLVDIHGHGHRIQRAELGYGISAMALNEFPIKSINGSSIENLAGEMSSDVGKLERILRGNESLGWFLENHGYDAIPSPSDPFPGAEPYFNGGYNTRKYGSHASTSIDAIQIESCRSVRNPENITDYSHSLSLALKDFLCLHYYQKDTNGISNTIKHACRLGLITVSNGCIDTISFWSTISFYFVHTFMRMI